MFRLGASQLGPGPGEWLVEDPRVHGLSSAKLAMAAERHARELDQRDCLLVVKDGVIVHETYREGGDAETLREELRAARFEMERMRKSNKEQIESMEKEVELYFEMAEEMKRTMRDGGAC